MVLDYFIVLNLFIQLISSSHLIIFRDEIYLNTSKHVDDHPVHKYKRLMCVSDRPKDAIVWNTKMRWINYNFREEKTEFKDSELSNFTINYEQQCRLDVDDKESFSLWSQKGGKWNIVNSYDVPMGPVYDSRWENFTDFESFEYEPITIIKNGVNSTLTFGATGSFVFSIRGQHNAQIIICESDEIENNFCYIIIIGYLATKISGIGKCKYEEMQYLQYTQPPCGHFLTEYKHEYEPLNFLEWRTFLLTWEENTRTIELFDPDKKILSYSDHNSTYRNFNTLYKIFYRSPSNYMKFRFHDYSYTVTTDRGAILRSSSLILGNSQKLCIDMMVGLCKHCELIVNIVDGSGKRRVTKTIRRSSKYDSIEHDLPMWQNDIIKEMNISDYSPPIRLELVTSVISEETDKRNDHWAIRNFEHCLPKGIVKLVKMTTNQDYKIADGYIYYTICQRLSYDDPKSEMFEAINMHSTTLNNFENCPNYNIGPNCAIKCASFFQHDCHGVQVCTKNGCSCAQGWQGSNCTTKCSAGSYGFGCSKNCSTCIDNSCDSYTGICYLGCKSGLVPFHERLYCNIAPPPVKNLQVKSITSTKAELKWSSPEPPNGILKGYNLTIKVLYYIGCENEKKTPEYLKITKIYPNIVPTTEVSYNLTDLVPYVTYEVTVIGYNAKIGNKTRLIFSTKPRNIHTKIFSNITFLNNEITWDNPADCWTITGPIEGSRVIITGVSENVKDFFHSYDTKLRILNLKTLEIYGNEIYQAKVYVLHEPGKSINITAYTDIHFTTDPSLPSKFRNLAIVEVDESTATLRWQEPLPPTNGELDYYIIRFLGKDEIFLNEVKVYLNETCYLWKNSFCKTFSHPSVKIHDKGTNDSVPEIPEIISITEVNKGVINLKWKHTSITGGMMKKFIIFSEILDTELQRIPSQNDHQTKVVPIHKYEPEYSTYLYLLPSTRYGLFIQGVTLTQSGKLSTQTIETNSALDFQYEPRPVLDNDTLLINIVIPPVINNTKDSQLHIIVKGPSICIYGGKLSKQILEDIQVEYYEVAWRVATFPTYQTANLSFTIGDDHIYGTVSNCPLNIGSSYVIVLLVYEKVHLNMNTIARPLIWQSQSIQVGEIPRIHHESWAIPLILAFLCIAVTMYYCSRRRRNTEYFDKKRCHGITESISIHPTVAEKKNSQSSNSTKVTNQTEHVYEEISDMVDVQGSMLKTLSNSSGRINQTVTTEPIYLEIIDTVELT